MKDKYSRDSFRDRFYDYMQDTLYTEADLRPDLRKIWKRRFLKVWAHCRRWAWRNRESLNTDYYYPKVLEHM